MMQAHSVYRRKNDQAQIEPENPGLSQKPLEQVEISVCIAAQKPLWIAYYVNRSANEWKQSKGKKQTQL
jgi:hypothetical protein